MRHFLAGILLFTCWSLFAQKASVEVDRVVVYKSERKLVLMSHGEELRSYKVALGSEPVGPKTQHGHPRNPDGGYTLDSQNPNRHLYKCLPHLISKLERHRSGPRSWASVPEATSCCTDFPRSTHG